MAFAANLANGNRVYQQHCSNCHGPRGLSINSGVPNFARNEGLQKPDMMLLQVVKTGRKGQPPFFGILADQDILDALAFSRTLR
jgi:cytochrome c6